MKKSIKIALLGLSPLLGFSLPILNLFAPLALWLLWRNDSPRINTAGKNILCSQISWFIWILMGTLVLHLASLSQFEWLLFFPWAFFTIIQAIKISGKEDNYVMPLTIPFLH